MPISTRVLLLLSALSSLGHASPIVAQTAQLVGRDVPALNSDGYDYVIIGGGTSGLTVANRLTEDGTKTVLVIESGKLDDQEPGVLVPGYVVNNDDLGSKYVYNLSSTPQQHLGNRTYGVYAGHVVGGGSAVNGLVFDRGTAGDYDLWEALGNRGWGWHDLLPFFKKSETFTPQKQELAEQYGFAYDVHAHGFDGPVQSSMPGYVWPGTLDFFEAWQQMGVDYTPDGTNGSARGVFWFQASVDPRKYTRSYARTAHYDAAKKRANFHLLTGQTVTKIVLQNKKATGVMFVANATAAATHVRARREVILAAGAVHSPQVLQLSGIGANALLSSIGVKTLVDLPGVGENLQDHPSLYFRGSFTNDHALNPTNLTTNATFAAEQLARYYASASGPYTLARGAGGAFLPLSQILPAAALPGLLASFTTPPPAAAAAAAAVRAGYQRQAHLLRAFHAANRLTASESSFVADCGLAQSLQKPLSRGRITLASASPFAAPVVDYGVLSHPADLAVLVALTRVNRALFTQPALAKLGPKLTLPDPEAVTDRQLEEVVRENLQPSMAHPCCTTPMGRRGEGAVVDGRLRVHGVRGLRVVDAGVMPLVPATHLSASVYAVAEKAAHMIMEDAGGY
ncbi:hypothetical protein EDC01DRAFT_305609 [Geopyxis carbonaria]|nr:hypothetical protein EDC01DRAFT_305609 [Geopyxis carbonaria]